MSYSFKTSQGHDLQNLLYVNKSFLNAFSLTTTFQFKFCLWEEPDESPSPAWAVFLSILRLASKVSDVDREYFKSGFMSLGEGHKQKILNGVSRRWPTFSIGGDTW